MTNDSRVAATHLVGLPYEPIQIYRADPVRSRLRVGRAIGTQARFSTKPNQPIAASSGQLRPLAATASDDAVVNWWTEAPARRPEVRRILLRQRAQVEALDDLEQDVVLALLRLGVRPRKADPTTVIWTICRNVLARYREREKTRLSVELEVAESLIASFDGPEDGLNRDDAWSLCCKALAPLAPRPRVVIYAHHIMELSLAEVATRLTTTEGSVRVALSRGMARLIADHGGETPQNGSSLDSRGCRTGRCCLLFR